MISSRTRKMAKRSSKGSPSWHTLLPWRSIRESQRLELPVEHVGLLSYLTYFWMDGFMWRAFRSGVDRAKLWTCPAVDTAEQNAESHCTRFEDCDRNRDTDVNLHEHPFPFYLLIRTTLRINKLYIKSKCIEVYERFRTSV